MSYFKRLKGAGFGLRKAKPMPTNMITKARVKVGRRTETRFNYKGRLLTASQIQSINRIEQSRKLSKPAKKAYVNSILDKSVKYGKSAYKIGKAIYKDI